MADDVSITATPVTALVEIESCNRFSLAGKQKITVGREANNDIILAQDPYVSRNHAVITLKDGQYWLEDLQSNNGTSINHNPVTEATEIHHGDEVMIGRTKFKVE
jgi:pSer/pThr/pTyr-binding forkhead associated (FHA) protein